MPLTSLREYLDKHNTRYIVISHSPAFTAQNGISWLLAWSTRKGVITGVSEAVGLWIAITGLAQAYKASPPDRLRSSSRTRFSQASQ